MYKKKVLVFIDNDVIVRYFIANDTFKELEDNYEIKYVFNQDPGRFDFKTNEIVLKKISNEKMIFTYIPRKRIGRWFLLYIINVFRQQRRALRKNGSRQHYLALLEHETNQIGKRNVFLAKIAGLPIFYQLITLFFKKKLGIHKDIIQTINNEKPDILIHPCFLSGYFINELFRASKKFNIPFLILVNSWDNCCSKAFCTGKPDKLVVWGEQARRHAKQYLGLKDNRIECFGSAQFEIYKTPPQNNRKELAEFFNVDPHKRIILYAGVSASANETSYLKLLDNAITESTLPNCQVIYRPHPWRGGLVENEQDFHSLNWKNVVIDPTMEEFYKSIIRNPNRKMFLADYSISNKLLTLADGVISPLSTMLIESLLKGKPVLAFFPEKGEKEVLRLEFIHFSEFIKIKEANSCFTEIEFIPSCKKLISQIGDESIAKILKKKSEYFIANKKETYGYQLAQLCDQINISQKKTLS